MHSLTRQTKGRIMLMGILLGQCSFVIAEGTIAITAEQGKGAPAITANSASVLEYVPGTQTIQVYDPATNTYVPQKISGSQESGDVAYGQARYSEEKSTNTLNSRVYVAPEGSFSTFDNIVPEVSTAVTAANAVATLLKNMPASHIATTVNTTGSAAVTTGANGYDLPVVSGATGWQGLRLSGLGGPGTESVFNPPMSGGDNQDGLSSVGPNPDNFPMDGPAISSIFPFSVAQGYNGTMNITGVNFRAGAVINWDGVPYSGGGNYNFVNSTYIGMVIVPSDTPTSPATHTISVTNPDGKISNGRVITVTVPPPPCVNDYVGCAQGVDTCCNSSSACSGNVPQSGATFLSPKSLATLQCPGPGVALSMCYQTSGASDGAWCRNNSDCSSGRCTILCGGSTWGYCVSNNPPGTACIADSQCGSGICNAGTSLCD